MPRSKQPPTLGESFTGKDGPVSSLLGKPSWATYVATLPALVMDHLQGRTVRSKGDQVWLRDLVQVLPWTVGGGGGGGGGGSAFERGLSMA